MLFLFAMTVVGSIPTLSHHTKANAAAQIIHDLVTQPQFMRTIRGRQKKGAKHDP